MIANKLRYKQVDSSSGFDPSQLSGLALWLDASDASTFAYSSGSNVSTWYDKSSNQYQFSQSTTGKQPVRTSSVLNGLSGVSFSGGKLLESTAFDFSAGAFTVCIVAKKTTAYTSNEGMFGVGALNGLTFATWNSRYGVFRSNVSPYDFSPYSYISSTGADLLICNSAGVSSGSLSLTLQKNGETGTYGFTQTGFAGSTNLSIGGSYTGALYPDTYYGNILEIVVFNRQLTSAEKTQMLGYFTRWGDQFFTSLLLHMDGTNGSTTFTDSSPNALTVTASGGAQISTAQAKSGFSEAGYFNGTNSFVSTPDSTALEFGSGDFTVEAWIYPTSNTGMRTIFSKTSNGYSPLLFTVNNGNLVYYMSSTGTGWNVASGVSAGSVTLNAWNHIAISRSGTTVKPFVNGVAGTSTTTSASLVDNTGPVRIGANYFTGTLEYFAGYMDEVRIIKGVAKYTANFTPPASPFPNS